MFESSAVITMKYIENMISDHIEYFQKTVSKEIQTMKNELLTEMRDELFYNIKLKNNFISEKIKAEMDKFHLKSAELNYKLYEDMHKQDNNNMAILNKLRKDVFYKE